MAGVVSTEAAQADSRVDKELANAVFGKNIKAGVEAIGGRPDYINAALEGFADNEFAGTMFRPMAAGPFATAYKATKAVVHQK